jgi:hypothetical protein
MSETRDFLELDPGWPTIVAAKSPDAERYIVGDMAAGRTVMEFIITYSGPLASNGSLEDKHRIRKVLHPQLRELWQQQPLSRFGGEEVEVFDGGSGRTVLVERARLISWGFGRGMFRFVPTVMSELKLVCSLNIDFLRRADSGQLIKHGGDLDNRLKTLFDALTVPDPNQIKKGWEPTPDERPMFVLLENDALITGFCIQAQRLLEPRDAKSTRDDVKLSIKVRIMATEATELNTGFPLH